MIDLIVEPAKVWQQEDALRILFQHCSRVERQEAIGKLRAFLDGELNAEGLLVARQRDQIKGVILAVPAAGAAGLIWPPQITEPSQAAVEDALVHSAVNFLRKKSAKIVQALLQPHEMPLGRSLERNGFAHITSLEFLRYSLHLTPEQFNASETLVNASETLAFENYGVATKERLETTLLATYDGTLDCPELNGVRTIDEIIAGHQAQGVFDPGKWRLAMHEGNPVGVLLLSEVPEWHAWEIVYLGIVAAARGRGFGRQLVLKAVREACQSGARQLIVSVDHRNFLARRLYSQLGFESWDRRDVYLAILSGEIKGSCMDSIPPSVL